jgi:hypothetical protein
MYVNEYVHERTWMLIYTHVYIYTSIFSIVKKITYQRHRKRLEHEMQTRMS